MITDVFFSYPRVDVERARPVVEALRKRGITVWFDETEIGDGDAITRRIVEGLGQARTLVAWYSAAYPRSRACQWELTAAYLAAQHEGGDLSRRLIILNAEGKGDHIRPADLRDQRFLEGADDLDALAERIEARLDRAATWIGDIRPLQGPPWLSGQRRTGSNRFVGRVADLWEIHGGLTAGSVAVITGAPAGCNVAQVQGMGGIGKSMLAEEYALRFAAAYPAGIVWLSASRLEDTAPKDLEAEAETAVNRHLYDLALRLGLPVQGQEPPAIAGMVERHLREQKDPYLWVVDDLPADATDAVLRRWTAPSPNGCTLVTTRGTRLDGKGKIHRLDILAPEDAYQLLTSRWPPKNDAERAAAAAILTELGNHALAVDVAGAALRHMGYADFLADLCDPDEDALALAEDLAGELPGGHPRGIAATLLQSIRRLSPEGTLILQLASLLAPEPIPKPFLQDVLAEHAGDEKEGRRAALRGMAACEAEALVDNLGAEGVSVHVLVSRTVRQHAPAADSLRAAAVNVLNRVMPEAVDIRNHGSLDNVVGHARALTVSCDDPDTASLLLWLGRYELEKGAYRTATAIFKRVFEVRRSFFGDEHPDTLTSMNNLAGTLQTQGDLTGARALQEQVLAVRRRVLGDGHPDTLISMNNLALTLQSQGDLTGARALQEQVVAALRRKLGDEHPDTLTYMNNLAGTLQTQGDLTGARALEEQVLSARRRILGDEHPDTLTSMNNLAGTLWDQGDLMGARALQEQVLAMRRRILGDEHPDTLTSMSNLAGTLQTQGDLTGARALEEQVLSARRRILGDEHPDTLTSMNNLASTLRTQGELAGARELQERALAARRRVLGDEHPDTLTSIDNLALTLWKQGERTGAKCLFQEALPIAQRTLGDAHPTTRALRDGLAVVTGSSPDPSP